MSTEAQIKKINPEETWPIRHEILWPDHPYDFVKLEEDKEGFHYGVFVGDQLVTIVSLFVNGSDAQFRKLATLEDHQGKGHGSDLLNHVIEKAERKGAKKIWCNARADKSGFYQRFGMYETEKKFVKEGIDYVIMEKVF